jgi:hypothetical protein
VSKLHPQDPESIVSDHVTASVATITGRMNRDVDSAHLLNEAISRVQDIAATGGNRVLAMTV